MNEFGYSVYSRDNKFIFEKGRLGWLAAPLTHLGLFILLSGVAVTAASSYSGRFDLLEGQETILSKHVEKSPSIGNIPEIKIRLLSTRRENNKDGSPRQWYSKLLLAGALKSQEAEPEISVNNPCTFNNVDFNQADWKLAGVKIRLAGNELNVAMEEMGHDSMGIIPIADDLIMVLALKDANAPLRIYFKHAESKMPRLFSTLARGGNK